jgi:hypothetical protein
MSSPGFHSIPQFGAIFDAALNDYAQKTGTDLRLTTHPLAAALESCHSPEAILDVLREQAHAFNQYRNGDWKIRLMRHLKPTVVLLLGLSTSGVLGDHGIGLVSHQHDAFLACVIQPLYLFPAEVSTSKGDICRCWSPASSAYLLSGPSIRDRNPQVSQAAKGVSTSYDALVELFECFEHYLGRLKIFTEIPSAVGEVLVKIMAELLSVLGLTIQQIKQGRLSVYYLVDTRPLS